MTIPGSSLIWPPLRALPLALLGLALPSCVGHDSTPKERAHDARFGWLDHAPPRLDPDLVCGHWSDRLGPLDRHASSHVSYPEAAPEASCYTRVVHAGRAVLIGRVPEGCAVPTPGQREQMNALAATLEKSVADPHVSPLYPCTLSAAQRRAADTHNARVLREVATEGGAYPYSAVIVPGYGEGSQAETSVVDWLPGDACHEAESLDLYRFGEMVERTERAADVVAARVAPLAIVTGGSPHSRMIEAFAMLYLLECVPGSRMKHVIVEPCAEHTHTNLRNAARWLVSMGGRDAYLVTDNGFQADYFQEWTGFDTIGGSIDARSMRDWGYLVGAWRQASVGIASGFWYTPYRFWAEPKAGVGSFTCVMSGSPGKQ